VKVKHWRGFPGKNGWKIACMLEFSVLDLHLARQPRPGDQFYVASHCGTSIDHEHRIAQLDRWCNWGTPGGSKVWPPVCCLKHRHTGISMG